MIASQDINPNFVSESASSSSPLITIVIEPAANNEPNPANLETATKAVETSAKAPPIPARPCPISSQLKLPNLLRPSASPDKDWTIIKVDTLPAKEPKPLTLLRIPRATTSSPRAPPIAVRDLPISSHENPENLLMASPRILQLSAIAKRLMLVLSGTLTPFRALSPAQKMVRPPPTPIRPLAISLSDKPPNLAIADARTFMDSATRIKLIDALPNPLDPFLDSVFVMLSKLFVIILNIAAMVLMPLSAAPASICESVFRDAVKTPIAPAIPTSDVTLMLVVNACKLS